MCGIVGYVGPKDCSDVLVSALTKLEYRGYDSAGIAVFGKNGIETVKTKGKLKNLVDKMAVEGKPEGHVGIGHTRWATHGEPSDVNSHPHSGARVTIVHNGIIENYADLRKFLTDNGYHFVSQTDTEVVPNLIDYYFTSDKSQNTIEKFLRAVKNAVSDLKGSYALEIISSLYPEDLVVVR